MEKSKEITIPEPEKEKDQRRIILGERIELYQDPETETKSEGYAFVWAILAEDKEYYELQVSFCADPAGPGRKFTRKYRKYPAAIRGHV